MVVAIWLTLGPVIAGESGVPSHMILETVGWVGVVMIVGSLPFQTYALYKRLLAAARKSGQAGSRSGAP